MNGLTYKLTEEFKPVMGLICYHNGSHEYYLESHPIDEAGQLLEGKPLEQDTMLAMMDALYDMNAGRIRIGGLVPEPLLYCNIDNGGDYHIIWYRPEQKQKLYFSDSLNLPNGLAWSPALLFSAGRKNLKVFALESNERPKADTQLMKAPFYNIYQDGGVCLGSAKAQKPKDANYSSFIEYWEAIWWNSAFTHLTHDGNPTKSPLNLLWKRLLADDKIKWSGLKELMPYKQSKTLANLIK